MPGFALSGRGMGTFSSGTPATADPLWKCVRTVLGVALRLDTEGGRRWLERLSRLRAESRRLLEA